MTSLRKPVRPAPGRGAVRRWGLVLGLGGVLAAATALLVLVAGPVGANVTRAERIGALQTRRSPQPLRPAEQPIATPDLSAVQLHGPLFLDDIAISPSPHPFAGQSDQELRVLLGTDPESLGTASIGSPNRGALFNGVRLEEGQYWDLRVPAHSFTTPLVAASLLSALRTVNQAFEETPRLGIGDISREGGGYLRPHRSHQSGLDVDLGYYYQGGYAWYVKATAATLDRPRTLCLVRALLGTGAVEYLFIDRAVQQLLREYAESVGASQSEFDTLFGVPPKRGVVRHTWGHDDHIHVRFFDGAARARSQRLHPLLRERGRYR